LTTSLDLEYNTAMTLNNFRSNYEEIRAALLKARSPDETAHLFLLLDFTLVQINAMLNAAPETVANTRA
jgi:hypothetical protein